MFDEIVPSLNVQAPNVIIAQETVVSVYEISNLVHLVLTPQTLPAMIATRIIDHADAELDENDLSPYLHDATTTHLKNIYGIISHDNVFLLTIY